MPVWKFPALASLHPLHRCRTISPHLVAKINPKLRTLPPKNLESFLLQELLHRILRSQTFISARGGKKVMAGNAQHLSMFQSFSHALQGGTLGSFYVHLEKGNSDQSQLPPNGIDRSRRNRNSCRNSRTVAEIFRGILDGDHLAAGPGDCAVNGDYVFELIVLHKFFQAAISAGVCFDANDLALGSDQSRKCQRFLSDARSGIDNHISNSRVVPPEEIFLGQSLHARHIEPDEWLMVRKEAAPGLVDPDSAVIKDPLDSMSPRPRQLTRHCGQAQPKPFSVEMGFNLIDEPHKEFSLRIDLLTFKRQDCMSEVRQGM